MGGLAILLGKGKPSQDSSSSMAEENGSKAKFAELADIIDEAISSGGLQGSLKKQFVQLMASCYENESMEESDSDADSEMGDVFMKKKSKY